MDGFSPSVLAPTSIVNDVTREALVLNTVLTVYLLRQGRFVDPLLDYFPTMLTSSIAFVDLAKSLIEAGLWLPYAYTLHCSQAVNMQLVVC